MENKYIEKYHLNYLFNREKIIKTDRQVFWMEMLEFIQNWILK